MKLNEIKEAVRRGLRVCWSNELYEVRFHTFKSGDEQWNVVCTSNDYTNGLTHRDGVTMNGQESEFFIATEAL